MILKIIIISLFISYFQPIQDLFSKIFDRLICNTENKTIQALIDYLYIGTGCPKCLSFWTALFCTHNIILSMGISLLVMIIQKIIQRL